MKACNLRQGRYCCTCFTHTAQEWLSNKIKVFMSTLINWIFDLSNLICKEIYTRHGNCSSLRKYNHKCFYMRLFHFSLSTRTLLNLSHFPQNEFEEVSITLHDRIQILFGVCGLFIYFGIIRKKVFV